MRFGIAASLLLFTVLAIRLGHLATVSAQSGTRTEFTIDAAPAWFEEFGSAARISPDGRWAAYRGRPFQLYDLTTHRQTREPIWPGLDVVQWIAFSGSEVFLNGRLGGESGWFRHGPSGPIRVPVPPDADPKWSADGTRVAYFRAGSPDSGVFAGPLDHVRAYRIRGAVSGLAWTPSRDTLVAVTMDTTGVSALSVIELVGGRVREIARDLDAVTAAGSPIAVLPDGRRAFIGLAGDHRPVDAERQRPNAPARRVSIYEIDLSNGRKHIVAAAEPGADLLAPSIAGGRVYWTRAETRASVVTLPIRGGRVRALVADAAVPSWRPDGRQVGFYFGDWRVADWAINWDAGVLPVDARGVAAGPRTPLITNYAEDFEPEWSPRGTWIAYHSHRSPKAVPYYGAPGSTDDIWLRRVGAPPRDTADIRLTDFGFEAGSPSWSRDGARLIFVSYDRNGVPRQNLLWLVTIDTVTGRPLRHSRVSLPPGVESVAWAAWSPVSDDIAIEDESGARGQHALWVMSPDSAHARRVVEFPMRTYGGVAWTPDGKTLIYSALVEKYNQLFAVDVAGGDSRRLTYEAAQILHASVSPNGFVIAATRLEHRKTVVSAPLPH